ncbi:MAG TPA: M28 family peptidase [Terriglobia bacterium]|nr:M28 family peptidase [Terriglobia bacterium]
MKRKRYFIAPLFSFLLGLSLFAAGTLPLSELSADRYMQHVSFLASDDLKGRGNGSPELERAAEYIATQFRSFGLQTAGDNGTYFQKFDITTGAQFGSKNTLQVSGVSKEKGKDFVTMPVSSSGSYDGPIVFAGYGMTSESQKWDDYAGIDVKGKAVLVFRHDPEETNPAGRFAKDPTAPSTFIAKVRNARVHGAKAILFITDPNNHPGEPDTVGKATSDLEFRDLSILAMHVTRDSVMSLFTRSGRNMAEVQRAIDQDQKPQSFEFTNLKIRVSADIKPIRKTVRNVLASVQGSDPVLRNEWIVIGGHYDHLGLGDPHNSMSQADVGKIHHGADDNASGTAGVLELARLIARNKQAFKRSVLLITFAGEELGLFGSSHFVNDSTMPLPSIAAMINMDMIGRLSSRPLSVMGTGTSPEFPAWIAEANKEVGLNIALSNGGHEGSDHLSFNGKRIPTLFFFSGLHSDYHRPTDTAEKIDAKGAIQVLSLVAGTAELMANAPSKLLYTEVKEDRPQAAGGGGSPYGTYFGSVPDFRDDLSGVLFADVRADSPAGKAGLKPGDLLVEFAGNPIKNLYDFTDALAGKKPGDVVAVVVKRNGQSIKVNVTLEVRK